MTKCAHTPYHNFDGILYSTLKIGGETDCPFTSLNWKVAITVSGLRQSARPHIEKWSNSPVPAACKQPTQGLYSLSGKTSYRKISWSLEAARFGFKLFQSLWNLAGTSAALLPRCLSNFRAIRPLQHPISRLRDFTRFGGKTSYRLVNRGPVPASRHIQLSIYLIVAFCQFSGFRISINSMFLIKGHSFETSMVSLTANIWVSLPWFPTQHQRRQSPFWTTFVVIVGRLRMVVWPHILQGLKKGRLKSTFLPKIMKNRCLNSTF